MIARTFYLVKALRSCNVCVDSDERNCPIGWNEDNPKEDLVLKRFTLLAAIAAATISFGYRRRSLRPGIADAISHRYASGNRDCSGHGHIDRQRVHRRSPKRR